MFHAGSFQMAPGGPLVSIGGDCLRAHMLGLQPTSPKPETLNPKS